MMKKKVIISIFLVTFFSTGCTEVNHISTKTKLQSQQEIDVTGWLAKKGTIGSTQYVDEINFMAKKRGYKKALYRIMDDIDKNGEEIDKNDPVNNSRLYKLVSSLISNIGYVDTRTHYFRNKLNRAPKSLKELLYLNSRLPPDKRWKLISVKDSLYHMQGKDGEYNLKFLSYDIFCEAVYNKKGILLTEENDPINMGTFNYCAGNKERDAHTIFDVNPYLKWGNAPNSPQRNKDQIQKGTDIAYKNFERNKTKVLEHRKRIMNYYSGFNYTNYLKRY